MNKSSKYFSFERISTYKHRVLINKKQNVRNNYLRPAIFFDRDGVIIEDRHYLSDPAKVKILPGFIDLCVRAKKLNLIIVVLTNQSGISRGFFDWSDYELITEKMFSLIGKPFFIDAIYANGYKPGINLPDNCWRKPSPEMLITASIDLGIDLNNSILIGDRLSDIKCAYNAGIKNIFHVLTSHGKEGRKYVLEYYSDKINSLQMIDNLTEFPYDSFLSKYKVENNKF